MMARVESRHACVNISRPDLHSLLAILWRIRSIWIHTIPVSGQCMLCGLLLDSGPSMWKAVLTRLNFHTGVPVTARGRTLERCAVSAASARLEPRPHADQRTNCDGNGPAKCGRLFFACRSCASPRPGGAPRSGPLRASHPDPGGSGAGAR
jgi:hypothetical protein